MSLRIKLIFNLFIFCTSLAVTSTLEAATYYVSANGQGTSCSRNQPCTLNRALFNSNRSSATDEIVFTSGGNYRLVNWGTREIRFQEKIILTFEAGSYYFNDYWTFEKSATIQGQGMNATFVYYDNYSTPFIMPTSSNPLLHVNDLTLAEGNPGSRPSTAIKILNNNNALSLTVDHVKFENFVYGIYNKNSMASLEITDSTFISHSTGITSRGATGFIIEGNLFEIGTYGNGIDYDNLILQSTDRITDNTFQGDSSASVPFGQGILSRGSNAGSPSSRLPIYDNYFAYCYIAYFAPGEYPHTYEEIFSNVFENNSAGIYLWAAPPTPSAANMNSLIYSNHIYGTSSNSNLNTYGIVVANPHESIVTNNLVTNQFIGIWLLSTQSIVAYNTVVENEDGISSSELNPNNPDYSLIVNNVALNNTNQGIRGYGSTTSLGTNIAYGNGTNFAGNYTALDNANSEDDPQLGSDDCTPTSLSSPVVNAANTNYYSEAYDYYRYPRFDGAPDIGACEF